MRAIVYRHGRSEPSLEEIRDPVVREGEVVVLLQAAALNHRDVWIMQGKYPGIQEGIIMGSDGAGLYNGSSLLINPNQNWGTDSNHQSSGYQILGMPANGTFAERIVLPEDRLVPTPGHLSAEEAAALPLGGLTAYRVLFRRCELTSTDKVCISGIGGGVALLAFQFALALGAEVWVTSSDPQKIAEAKKMGAAGGFRYTEQDWSKSMKKASGGFDVIVDSAGGKGFSNLVSMCKPGARIGIYGGTRGTIQNLSPQQIFWKQISILGSTMGSDSDFDEMVDFVDSHKIHPKIDSIYTLEEVADAFSRMEKGEQFGKIVLKIGAES